MTFWWREQRRAGDLVVDLAFTDTAGGVSEGGYASLNLGAHVGDDPARVEHNRTVVGDAFGVGRERMLFMHQVHGAAVDVVRDPAAREIPQADAVITTAEGYAATVLVADCTPVLLYDGSAGLVAAVHAGRPGMLAGVVPQTVATMRELGATDPQAVVGPSVCARCYEVPDEMRSVAAQTNPAAYGVSWTGTPAIDVAGAVVAQLRAAEVPLTWVPGCTRESDRLFSHRRDQGAGRFAGLVSFRREPA
ncbi:laccase domain-containing protein [Calidifontibacter sp. DB0510]|uniref:Laccase domain-containing protein n=1 Tax=Metallococcus carri TaxID=1656884 RepID=A0A967AZL4_9MICO|nr:polyphenol oxidase family protein [Metallococcus carri]NHN56031.1 laccase domain-containing protein [Metallococcus carri]NOP37512.1 laccase domain-containing protein [Calidifontibacter sp. DB2511S]